MNFDSIILARVPEDQEHVQACVRRRGKVVLLARLGRASILESETGFLHLEWLTGERRAGERKLRTAVEDSLGYLFSLDPLPDFWSYLIHHCSTASNVYAAAKGGVFWEWRQAL